MQPFRPVRVSTKDVHVLLCIERWLTHQLAVYILDTKIYKLKNSQCLSPLSVYSGVAHKSSRKKGENKHVESQMPEIHASNSAILLGGSATLAVEHGPR